MALLLQKRFEITQVHRNKVFHKSWKDC